MLPRTSFIIRHCYLNYIKVTLLMFSTKFQPINTVNIHEARAGVADNSYVVHVRKQNIVAWILLINGFCDGQHAMDCSIPFVCDTFLSPGEGWSISYSCLLCEKIVNCFWIILNKFIYILKTFCSEYTYVCLLANYARVPQKNFWFCCSI